MGKLIPGLYLHGRLESDAHLGTRLWRMERTGRGRENGHIGAGGLRVAGQLPTYVLMRPSQIEIIRRNTLCMVCLLA